MRRLCIHLSIASLVIIAAFAVALWRLSCTSQLVLSLW
jgi:hypothetical protein